MATFWSLPKTVREKIYRMHLLDNQAISLAKHKDNVRFTHYTVADQLVRKWMPPICYLSRRAEKEAAPIYYGENHFDLISSSHAGELMRMTYTRHVRLIRKVTMTWPDFRAREVFLGIAKMRRLQDFCIRVDEKAMVQSMLLQGRNHQRDRKIDNPSPQQQLAVLRYPGVSGLLAISGVPGVQFIKRVKPGGPQYGGPITGGVLDTQIRPKLMSKSPAQIAPVDRNNSFPFFSFPPEIRNRIYGFVLELDGTVHPSTAPPSSEFRKNSVLKGKLIESMSVLRLLEVSRQIHDEAHGIFYSGNAFEFQYPTHLHAFVLSLGPQRQNCIRDITLHYYNSKLHGIELADLTFPVLQQIKNIRRLHILLDETFGMHRKKTSQFYSQIYSRANPGALPGIKSLFALRGISDIRVRDTNVEKTVEKLKADKQWPNFPARTHDNSCVQISRMLEHFNAALAGAQLGKVNRRLLEDDKWHMKDEFPKLLEE
ncbi:hypothetical protein LTR37_012089 [Vermiconidia calcicola]|uniref:Uncharacterized protein n=1 Tax=Vermiconidia calcicola TaxID=1690605 RepID=A0ACC3N0Z2_9PEZI|nr:hypothetical protein LTR37_012089 [Vermiconidia calcicola]